MEPRLEAWILANLTPLIGLGGCLGHAIVERRNATSDLPKGVLLETTMIKWQRVMEISAAQLCLIGLTASASLGHETSLYIYFTNTETPAPGIALLLFYSTAFLAIKYSTLTRRTSASHTIMFWGTCLVQALYLVLCSRVQYRCEGATVCGVCVLVCLVLGLHFYSAASEAMYSARVVREVQSLSLQMPRHCRSCEFIDPSIDGSEKEQDVFGLLHYSHLDPILFANNPCATSHSLPPLEVEDEPHPVMTKFEKIWNEETAEYASPSVARATERLIRSDLLLTHLRSLWYSTYVVLQPLLIYQVFVGYRRVSETRSREAVIDILQWIAFLLLYSYIEILWRHRLITQAYKIGPNVTAALCHAIYSKCLRLDASLLSEQSENISPKQWPCSSESSETWTSAPEAPFESAVQATCNLTVDKPARQNIFSDRTNVDQSSALPASPKWKSSQVLSLINNDVSAISLAVISSADLIWSLYKVALTLFLIKLRLGQLACKVTLITLLVITLISYILFHETWLYQSLKSLQRENRHSIEHTLVNNIRTLKTSTWACIILRRLMIARQNELSAITKIRYLSSGNRLLFQSLSFLLAIATVTCLIFGRSKQLRLEEFLVIFAFSFQMEYPCLQFAVSLQSLGRAMKSRANLSAFLVSPEVLVRQTVCESVEILETPSLPRQRSKDPLMSILVSPGSPRRRRSIAPESEVVVVLQKASIGYVEERALVRGLSLTIRRGGSVIVLGGRGSGKTCLLQTLLHEVQPLRGTVALSDAHGLGNFPTIAYCSERPWLQSATIEQNVLFGRPLQSEWYWKIINACALTSDLLAFAEGDQTVVGDHGAFLTHSQKHRLALARALYQNSSIYILDDFLAAIEPPIASHIIQHVIKDLLQDKCVVLATQNPLILPEADTYIVLDKLRCTVFESLEAAKKCPLVIELIKQPSSMWEMLEARTPQLRTRRACQSRLQPSTSLLRTPSCETPVPSRAKLTMYVDSPERGMTSMVISVLMALHVILALCSAIVFAAAIERGGGTERRDLAVYSVTTLSALVCSLIGTLMMIRLAGNRSEEIYNNFVERVCLATMTFVDSTPVAQMLQRLSVDMAIIDDSLPVRLFVLMVLCLSQLSVTALVLYTAPLLLLLLIPLTVPVVSSYQVYAPAVKNLHELAARLALPFEDHFAETLAGIVTIRAFGHQRRFSSQLLRKYGSLSNARMTLLLVNRWIALRFEIAQLILIGGVMTVTAVQASRGANLALFGIVILWSFKTGHHMGWISRQHAALNRNMISMQRISMYTNPDLCPQESTQSSTTKLISPRLCQLIEFHDVSFAYGHHGVPFLAHISFQIPAGAKVGIIGRSGSGKSTVLALLLRLYPTRSGKIILGDNSISRLPLSEYRSLYGVVSQDPCLVSGTVRDNLDGQNEHDDQTLMTAITKARLKEALTMQETPIHIQTSTIQTSALPSDQYIAMGDSTSQPNLLDYQIEDEGANLSLLQKQLLCIARILLKRAPYLLLDEPTSAVDSQTEVLIHQHILDAYQNSTVITASRRVTSLRNYDLILGLDSGRVIEFDTPDTLLGNSNSLFHTLMHEATASANPR